MAQGYGQYIAQDVGELRDMLMSILGGRENVFCCRFAPQRDQRGYAQPDCRLRMSRAVL